MITIFAVVYTDNNGGSGANTGHATEADAISAAVDLARREWSNVTTEQIPGDDVTGLDLIDEFRNYVGSIEIEAIDIDAATASVLTAAGGAAR